MKRGKPERREQYAAVLRQQVDRLAIMLEDILNISRLDMGKTKLHIVSLDVNKIVQQVVEKCAAQMDGHTRLQLQLHPDMPLILGDEEQVAQVVTNLLNNAISYTQNGLIHIKTCWDDVQNRICVVIEDTGIGIPAREIDHVFDRFYRGSNVSQLTMPGTGLGLSFVKELVDLHRGEIEIESEINEGTTIIIHLPIAPRFSAVA
jgi:signal transduction histidine kinase